MLFTNRAGTISGSVDMGYRLRHSFQPIGSIQQCTHLRIRQVIINIPAVPPVSHQAGFSEDHQVLGDIGLTQFERGFQMANTLLALTQDAEDSQAGGMSQRLE